MPLLEMVKSLTLGRRRRERVSLWGSREPHLSSSLLGTQGTYTSLSHPSKSGGGGGTSGGSSLPSSPSCSSEENSTDWHPLDHEDFDTHTLPLVKRHRERHHPLAQVLAAPPSEEEEDEGRSHHGTDGDVGTPPRAFNTYPRTKFTSSDTQYPPTAAEVVAARGVDDDDDGKLGDGARRGSSVKEPSKDKPQCSDYINFEPLTGLSSVRSIDDTSCVNSKVFSSADTVKISGLGGDAGACDNTVSSPENSASELAKDRQRTAVSDGAVREERVDTIINTIPLSGGGRQLTNGNSRNDVDRTCETEQSNGNNNNRGSDAENVLVSPVEHNHLSEQSEVADSAQTMESSIKDKLTGVVWLESSDRRYPTHQTSRRRNSSGTKRHSAVYAARETGSSSDPEEQMVLGGDNKASNTQDGVGSPLKQVKDGGGSSVTFGNDGEGSKSDVAASANGSLRIVATKDYGNPLSVKKEVDISPQLVKKEVNDSPLIGKEEVNVSPLIGKKEVIVSPLIGKKEVNVSALLCKKEENVSPLLVQKEVDVSKGRGGDSAPPDPPDKMPKSPKKLFSRDVISDKQHSISSLQSTLKKLGASINAPLKNSLAKAQASKAIQPKPTDVVPLDKVKQHKPTDVVPLDKVKQHKPTDVVPLDKVKPKSPGVVPFDKVNQPKLTGVVPLDKVNQHKPTGVVPLDKVNQPKLTGVVTVVNVTQNNYVDNKSEGVTSSNQKNNVSISSSTLKPELRQRVVSHRTPTHNVQNFICYSTTIKPEVVTVVSLPTSSSSSSLSSTFSSSDKASEGTSSGEETPTNVCPDTHEKTDKSVKNSPEISDRFGVSSTASSNPSLRGRPSTLCRLSFKSDMVTYKRRSKEHDEIGPATMMHRSSSTGHRGGRAPGGKSIAFCNQPTENISPVLRNKLSRAGVSKIESSGSSPYIRKRSIICDNQELQIGDVPSCNCVIKDDNDVHSDACTSSNGRTKQGVYVRDSAVQDFSSNGNRNVTSPDHRHQHHHISRHDIEAIRQKILYRKPSSLSSRYVRRVNSVLGRDAPRMRVLGGTSVRRAKSFKESNERDWDSVVNRDSEDEETTCTSSNQSLASEEDTSSGEGLTEASSGDELDDEDSVYQDCGDDNIGGLRGETNLPSDWRAKLEKGNDITLVKWVIKVDNNSIEEDDEDFYYDSLDDYYDDFDRYYIASKNLLGVGGENLKFRDGDADTGRGSIGSALQHFETANSNPITAAGVAEMGEVQKLKVKIVDGNWRTSGEKLMAKLVSNAEKDQVAEENRSAGEPREKKKKSSSSSKRNSTGIKKEHKSKRSKSKEGEQDGSKTKEKTDGARKKKGKFAISLESKQMEEEAATAAAAAIELPNACAAKKGDETSGSESGSVTQEGRRSKKGSGGRSKKRGPKVDDYRYYGGELDYTNPANTNDYYNTHYDPRLIYDYFNNHADLRLPEEGNTTDGSEVNVASIRKLVTSTLGREDAEEGGEEGGDQSEDGAPALDNTELFFSGPIPDEEDYGSDYKYIDTNTLFGDQIVNEQPTRSSQHRRSNVVFYGGDSSSSSGSCGGRKGQFRRSSSSVDSEEARHGSYDLTTAGWGSQEGSEDATGSQIPGYSNFSSVMPAESDANRQVPSNALITDGAGSQIAGAGDEDWGEVTAQMDDVWDSIGLMDDKKEAVLSGSSPSVDAVPAPNTVNIPG